MTINDQSKPRRTTGLVAAALLATTIIAGGSIAIGAHSANGAESAAPAVPASPTSGQAGFADLVARVKPAVVNIATTGKVEKSAQMEMPNFPPGSQMGEFFKRFGPNQRQGGQRQGDQGEGGNGRGEGRAAHALGSGFLIDPSGYIVTNNHVIDDAAKIVVTLTDGSSYTATLKGRDEKSDVALLKIDAPKPLPYVSFGDSDKAREGDWVIAVGNPFGLGGTVTAGIVSAHGRDIHSGPYDDYLQIDAPINPGNSGGPVFDQSGNVIGIDTAIYSPTGGSVGIGFAVTSNTASKVVAQLREHGTVQRGWLGVQMQPLTDPLAKAMGRKDSDGVLVAAVEPGSPAANAELQQGDVIIALDGKPVKGPRALAIAVADIAKGVSAKMTVWRDGDERSISVKVGSPPVEKLASADQPGASENPIGMALAPLSKDVRAELGLDAAAKGVLVAEVMPDSRAAESGIRAGDLILKVGNDAVTTPAEATQKLKAAEKAKKEAVPLLVMREGTTYYLALQLTAA